MDIYYVTSNAAKFQEASYIFRDSQEWNLKQFSMELEEIQGSAEEIVHHKAYQALGAIQAPLIVEDVSLSSPALNGLPGPYVKHFVSALRPAGFARLIEQASVQYADNTASFPHYFIDGYPRVEVSCHAVYIAPGLSPIYAVGTVEGAIVPFLDPSGNHGNNCNSIFIQKGHTRRYSELSLEELSAISMRKEALQLLFEKVNGTLEVGTFQIDVHQISCDTTLSCNR